MSPTTVESVIEEFTLLPLEDKEYVLEIMEKQLIEARRESVAARAAEALSNYEKGLAKKGTVTDMREDLESD